MHLKRRQRYACETRSPVEEFKRAVSRCTRALVGVCVYECECQCAVMPSNFGHCVGALTFWMMASRHMRSDALWACGHVCRSQTQLQPCPVSRQMFVFVCSFVGLPMQLLVYLYFFCFTLLTLIRCLTFINATFHDLFLTFSSFFCLFLCIRFSLCSISIFAILFGFAIS